MGVGRSMLRIAAFAGAGQDVVGIDADDVWKRTTADAELQSRRDSGRIPREDRLVRSLADVDQPARPRQRRVIRRRLGSTPGPGTNKQTSNK